MDYCNCVKLLLGLAVHILVPLTVAASYVDIDDIGEIIRVHAVAVQNIRSSVCLSVSRMLDEIPSCNAVFRDLAGVAALQHARFYLLQPLPRLVRFVYTLF